MKYPITPDYLASAPDPLVRLYSDLESKILEDICRRFKLSGEATESAIAQIKILQERGYSLGEIEKAIKKTLNLSEKELDEIFDRAVDRNNQYYDRMIEKADIVSAEYKGLDKEIAAIRKQTHDEFVNLTQSLGFAIRTGAKTEFLPIAKTYQKILDDAAAQVLSGGMDYNTAIKAAVKRLTDSGLQMVDYASGWHNRVDVAARRAVMTGVSQLSAQYAEQNAEILGTDLREVTAHSGARDTGTGWQNHKAWQGKVYSVSGTHQKYPSIYEACGWGQVDGLEGANCRHHHFPFVDGVSERTYTDEQLANIDPPPFEYQGKTYTAYEATQKQRQIETSMRKYKRDVIGYEAAGLTEDAQDAAIKLGRLSKEYKAFSKAAGLRTQPERAQVHGFGNKEAVAASSEYKRIEKLANSMYDMGDTNKNVDAWLRDQPIRRSIGSDEYPLKLHKGRQNSHITGTNEFKQYVEKLSKKGQFGPSRLVIDIAEIEELVSRYHGSGILLRSDDGRWRGIERITVHPYEIGIAVNNLTGAESSTTTFTIRYSKDGYHIAPDYPSRKGEKAKK